MKFFLLTPDLDNEKDILSEEKKNFVSKRKIIDAIKNHKIVSIVYNENKNNQNPSDPSLIGKSWRYICPVVYGELANRKNGTPTGKMAIRAYQTGGSVSKLPRKGTNKAIKPAWKLFRVDRILAWYNQEDEGHTFDPNSIPLYNPNGDIHFSRIVCQSPEAKQKTKPETGPTKTTDLANKNIVNTDKQNIQKNQTSSPKVLDKSQETPYISDKEKVSDVKKMIAPSTAPIPKQKVSEPQQPAVDTTIQNVEPDIEAQGTSPETKDNVNNVQDNPLTNKFKEMEKRWNDLNKDEEENI